MTCGRSGTDRYAGQWGGYTDPETGLALMGWRYYDPGTGRFLTKDPIGFAGGINQYAYVGNDPINFMDPSGLAWWNDADDFLQSGSDFSNGFTNTIGLGFITNNVNGWLGNGDVVNACSSAYGWGKGFGYGYNAAAVGEGAYSLYRIGSNAIASYQALRAAPDALIDIYHFTSPGNAASILAEGKIIGRGGIWRSGASAANDAYFSATSNPSTFVKTVVYGLSPSKQGTFVTARDIAWRPFGIRIVRGPVILP